MPEYGAEFWLEHQVDRRVTREQFEQIAPEHLRREESHTQKSRRYLFCDTCPITTYVFAKDYHGEAGPELTRLATEAQTGYDLFFLCGAEIPYANTWDRSGDQKRRWFQRQILGDLYERRLPHIPIDGDLESRARQVKRVLRQYRKYSNPLEIVV